MTQGGKSKAGDRRQAHGRAGEVLARSYLELQGYSILETNFRSRYGEIDIIARHEGIVAFVEVKTRLGKRHGEPFEAVGPRKQDQIRRMAQMWLAGHQSDPALRDSVFRFDVISVKMDDRGKFGRAENVPSGKGIGAARVKDSGEGAVKRVSGSIEHLEDAFR